MDDRAVVLLDTGLLGVLAAAAIDRILQLGPAGSTADGGAEVWSSKRRMRAQAGMPKAPGTEVDRVPGSPRPYKPLAFIPHSPT